MASGILSSQRALGSTAGFAIMGSLLALVVAAQLPGDLEPVVPDASERSEVADVVDEANPNAVPSVIGPAPSDPTGRSGSVDRSAVMADESFVNGMRFAELSSSPPGRCSSGGSSSRGPGRPTPSRSRRLPQPDLATPLGRRRAERRTMPSWPSSHRATRAREQGTTHVDRHHR